jgi:hypothetical protein
LGLGWNDGPLRNDIRESWRFEKGMGLWLLKVETCVKTFIGTMVINLHIQ